ncbi:hypothetical protein [Rhizobium sp. LC145]|uniref:hypothetical protein n=1 Tax=Rhizobium sp. LC145 TaxID=1120688 RepID=UPI00062A5049|nr:hypothetical protein [Rhizobium sp. LC145]KKX25336.1 hypothetical protein YH62_25680 [Rhizobium sp. LC145]TKT45361.1 hypothetical protein FDR95_25845 [Rhizobiaceae bacterium LC148]
MSRFEDTMAQSRSMAAVNMMRDTDKFVRRLYQSRQPLGTANADLERHMLAEGLVYRKDGPLLRLTPKGKELAREIGA